MIDQEIWKDIPGSEGAYQVSNLGRVKSFKRYPEGKIRKLSEDTNGYLQVALRMPSGTIKKGAHQLVALAFIPKPKGRLEVNHKDGNKQNNHVGNLEWVTSSENSKHAVSIGLYEVNNPSQKLTEAQVAIIKGMLSKGIYYRDIAALCNVSPSTIRAIRDGWSWAKIKAA